MQNNLVIVESPTKAKTIEKILGEGFVVKSSKGHIRDLKNKGLSIDLTNNFKPEYEIPDDKIAVVSDLKKQVKASQMVWLASDEDREGEAIAWHLYDVLGLHSNNTKRIVFHEITEKAIKEALSNPRDIDNNLVEAQQARRILDRLVGFQLSPVLWKKVKPSLSAGRVQSVTVRLIVDREREIQNFKQDTYFKVSGTFATGKGEELEAELNKKFSKREDVMVFLNKLKNETADFQVEDVTTSPAKRSPSPAFTTSTLQQEASRKLGFSVSQTMSCAQKLYEAGHITYMRTDSVNLSTYALNTAEQEIIKLFGKEYHKLRQYKTKAKGAQEAHEAIRPTHFENKEVGSTNQEKKLYALIWKRAIASQMADAKLARTTISINIVEDNGEIAKEKFISQGEVMLFDGFMKLYTESKIDDDESNEKGQRLPLLKKGESINRNKIIATQRFTSKPARYSEASLINKLEELGIGRPSTYAPTISTIISRNYIQKTNKEGTTRTYDCLVLSGNTIKESTKSEKTGYEKQKLLPTDIGIVVNDYLMEHFPRIMDYSFTANVENEFDDIANGKVQWQEMIQKFYDPFSEDIKNASENGDFAHSERFLGVEPSTGKNVIARIGRYGPMIQIGDPKDKKFAKIPSDKLIETITLEEALGLFTLPRIVGQYEGHDMVVGIGRFGAYVRHNGVFTSLDKTDDPITVTSEKLIELIENKRDKEKNKVINTFENSEIKVLNGRWGPYISFKGNNFKIPKDKDATTLSLEDCNNIIKSQSKDSSNTKGSATAKRFKKK